MWLLSQKTHQLKQYFKLILTPLLVSSYFLHSNLVKASCSLASVALCVKCNIQLCQCSREAGSFLMNESLNNQTWFWILCCPGISRVWQSLLVWFTSRAWNEWTLWWTHCNVLFFIAEPPKDFQPVPENWVLFSSGASMFTLITLPSCFGLTGGVVD